MAHPQFFWRPGSRLTFGRFKGWSLDRVPRWYAMWLTEQPWLRPELRAALEDELDRRFDGHAAREGDGRTAEGRQC